MYLGGGLVGTFFGKDIDILLEIMETVIIKGIPLTLVLRLLCVLLYAIEHLPFFSLFKFTFLTFQKIYRTLICPFSLLLVSPP